MAEVVWVNGCAMGLSSFGVALAVARGPRPGNRDGLRTQAVVCIEGH